MGVFDKLFKNRKNAYSEQKVQEPATNNENTRLHTWSLAAARQGASKLPSVLSYPNDPIANLMFEPYMKDVSNSQCNYQFRLYTEIADVCPEVRKNRSGFEIDETHIYWKKGESAWCSVSVMKAPSVRTTPLRNWVDTQDQFLGMLGQTSFLRYPSAWGACDYQNIEKAYVNQCDEYDRLHQFDESHVFFHVFTLNKQCYKKFILLARKNEFAWRVECNIPSQSAKISSTDFAPPALVFGSFFPLTFQDTEILSAEAASEKSPT